MLTLVREDREGVTSGVSVVLPKAAPSSYVTPKELLTAYKQEIGLKRDLLRKVEDAYFNSFHVYVLKRM